MLKNISFHPKLVAVLDLILGIVMLWWLKQISFWWVVCLWFIFRELFWFGFIRLMYYPAGDIRWRHFLSLTVYSFGNLFFLLFMDWRPAWNVMAGVFLVLPFLSFWILPSEKVDIIAFLKPHLRWRFIMCCVGLAGVFAGAAAIVEFKIFYRINAWLWLVLSSLIATALAGWWWKEYNLKYNQQFLSWIVIFFILILEFFWVLMALTMGYLANTMLLLWYWYILWLLARFNMSADGINWRKQSIFLSANAVLYLIFLMFVVRWR